MSLSDEQIDNILERWRYCQRFNIPYKPFNKSYKTDCSSCGTKITKYGKTGLCPKCISINSRKCKRPNKHTLLEELKKSNFLRVGKKYGVSDNAVRKWCRSYGLPTTRPLIKITESAEIAD